MEGSSELPKAMRTNRRGVLVGSGVAAVVAFSGSPSLAQMLTLQGGSPFRAIYDEREVQAADFARDAAAQGWAVRGVRGDPTDLWYHELSPQWRRAPVTVMGVTRWDTLFILERLSWDAGLRVTERRDLPDTDLIAWTIAMPAHAPATIGQLRP